MGKHDRAQVDPVTGEVLETPELRETSLRDLRQLMKVSRRRDLTPHQAGRPATRSSR